MPSFTDKDGDAGAELPGGFSPLVISDCVVYLCLSFLFRPFLLTLEGFLHAACDC